MATKTREQLIARTLRKLGAIGAGQAPSPEDAQAIDDSIGPVMSDLMARGVYAWGDPDQIEEDAYEHLAELLAEACAEDFGKMRDEGKRMAAETRLRQLDVQMLSGQPLRAEYF
jgi:hypothetical protein